MWLELAQTREYVMKKVRWIFLSLLLASAPSALAAQGITIGARAGTLGLGGEVAVGLSDIIVLRGGYGVIPYDYDSEFDGQDYTVSLPSPIWTAGMDIYLGGGPFRIMGGVMGRGEHVRLRSDLTGGQEIGDVVYDVDGTLKGTLVQDDIAPFAGIGFGKHTEGGFGFFVDIGAAFSGAADVELSVSGPIASVPGIEEELLKEAENIEDDAGDYLKIWPIVSIGIKIPLSTGY